MVTVLVSQYMPPGGTVLLRGHQARERACESKNGVWDRYSESYHVREPLAAPSPRLVIPAITVMVGQGWPTIWVWACHDKTARSGYCTVKSKGTVMALLFQLDSPRP